MIEFSEHYYSDDPNDGHPDVKTFLKNVSYFFIGNGSVQAAVQYSPGGEGSPLGLLIMDPEKLKPKRGALTLDREAGIAKTMLSLIIDGKSDDYRYRDIYVAWDKTRDFPVIKACWRYGKLLVEERFYCKDMTSPEIIREITIINKHIEKMKFSVLTGLLNLDIKKDVEIAPYDIFELELLYTLAAEKNEVSLDIAGKKRPLTEQLDYWSRTAKITTGSDLLDHYFRSSSIQLGSVISNKGKVDASIWQYNREWVRDHSFMVLGLLMAGHHEKAYTVLDRLLAEFVTDDGACQDSSEFRTPDEVELDQNGLLLYTLKKYVLWTDDIKIISKHWDKIYAVAEFPLKNVFRHQPSGMFYNRREYWERHKAYGIDAGLELAYQFFNVLGLQAAAFLARKMSRDEEAVRWLEFSETLKNSMLKDEKYNFVDERGFIKRRSPDSSIQETINIREEADLPEGIPLKRDIEHFLNPDSSCVYPIVYGLEPPDSEIASATMNSMEELWNQDWEIGGYGRYNFTSEADSSGPWPIASLFIARAYLDIGDYDKVWRVLDWLNTVPGSLSGSWFECYCDRISPPYAQLGIIPWTWAEMIMLFVNHILGIRPEEDGIHFSPVILPKLSRINSSIRIGSRKMQMDIKTDSCIVTPCFQCNIPFTKISEREIVLPYSKNDIIVEAIIPVKE